MKETPKEMRKQAGIRRWLRGVVILFVVPLVGLPIASTDALASVGSPSSEGAWKAAHDTDPHVPITNGAHHTGRPANHPGALMALSAPTDFSIGQDQEGQQTTYWCGPAAEAEALGLLSLTYLQSSEATALKTTTSGTAWSGVNANVSAQFQTSHPMRDVLSYQYYLTYNIDPAYAVVAVPYTPSQTDINNYVSHLTFDISNYWPVIGNAWEVAGYAHLTGHPMNQTIFHWFTIYGYHGSGSTTSYEDSATTVWSTVPAYTDSFSSSTMVGILGGRGYVW